VICTYNFKDILMIVSCKKIYKKKNVSLHNDISIYNTSGRTVNIHWVDSSAGGLLALEGIISPVVSVSAH
jgi:hypothetical protein